MRSHFRKHLSDVLFLTVILWCPSGNSLAQVENTLDKVCYAIDSTETGSLQLAVDNLSFFKDNEFSGTVMKGYSLPGLWVTPKLTYQPLDNIRLEAGFRALIYSGAYKFPSYAYHDIAKWKGSQYQQGAHMVPWFRSQFALKHLQIILGNLYGGVNHQLAQPLYNPELALTADPEFGFQLLWDTRPFHLDAWINWESFIFDGDTHQEAFVVGLSSKLSLNAEDASLHAYIPVQGTIQHRGGEQDTARSVQTLCNAGVGLGVQWNSPVRALKHLKAEAWWLGYVQQSGSIWPFHSGVAYYARAEAGFHCGLQLHAGYFHANKFISLLGCPYFGSVSTKTEGACYPDHPKTFHVGLDYLKWFGSRYGLGAKIETYCNAPGTMRHADGTTAATSTTFNTTFGVYLRICPNFLLKKW